MPAFPGGGAAAAAEPGFPPSVAMVGGYRLQAFLLSSGNPRIEETRGIVHLFSDTESLPNSSSNSNHSLPVGRKPLVCVLGVPNHKTYADFCQFCGSFIQHIVEMRVVRIVGREDQYSVLISFDSQESADSFYRHFNTKPFSSLEVDVCRVLYTMDVQYTGSIEYVQTSSTEQPSCPVCLERLDQDTSGILTTICNHSFHCSCISKWTDSSCPVCRYCLQQPAKSTCSVCSTSENLWFCLICGFVGCGRYKEGHSARHWKETQHCYSLELETQKVWDYAGEKYVHRLIQSKTDGKLVESKLPCSDADDGCKSCGCVAGSGIIEALFNSRFDAIVKDYNELLTTQLENHQRKINEDLTKTQEIWSRRILEIEEREQGALRLKDEKINDLGRQLADLLECQKTLVSIVPRTLKLSDEKIEGLEKQVGDLRACLDRQMILEQEQDSNEIRGGIAFPKPGESSSKNSGKRSYRGKRKS